VDKLILEEASQPEVDVMPIKMGMPHETYADMPAQSLRDFDTEGMRTPVNPKGVRSQAGRRWLVLGSAFLLSLWGINEMHTVLGANNMTFIQYVFLVLFGLTFSWITVAFSGSIVGFFLVLAQRRGKP